MVKTNKEQKRIEYNLNFWISMIFLGIMLLSVVGFALMTGGSNYSNSENNLPDNLDLQQFENEGQIFWAAIRNKEQFIFFDIDTPELDLKAQKISSEIKSKSIIKLQVEDFDLSSQYLFEKALRGLKIPYSISNETNCDENTLVLTYNENKTGDCIKIISNESSAYQFTENIVYHLVK